MTYQQIQTASEPPIDGDSFLTKMLQIKMFALSNGIMVTDNFISEVEEFEKRNSLSLIHKDLSEFSNVSESCPRCLKAFMFSVVVKHGLSKEAMKIIEELVPGELGHNGYYLDEGKVKPVQLES